MITLNNNYHCDFVDYETYVRIKQNYRAKKNIIYNHPKIDVTFYNVINIGKESSWLQYEKDKLIEILEYKNFNRCMTKNAAPSDWCASLGIHVYLPAKLYTDERYAHITREYFDTIEDSLRSLFETTKKEYLMIWKHEIKHRAIANVRGVVKKATT